MMPDDDVAPSPEAIAFVEGMVRDLPFLEGLLAEHVEGYDEILSTLFMGDVARLLRGEGVVQASAEQRAAILDWSERALTEGGDLAGDIVVTGLLEAMQDLRPGEQYLVEEMGPELRRAFALLFVSPADAPPEEES